MSRRSWIAAALAVVALAAPSYADLKLPRISPDAKVTQTVGLTDLTVTYSRPGVKGRTVWGDLVPYDYRTFMESHGAVVDPAYGRALTYQAPRTVRLGLKFSF